MTKQKGRRLYKKLVSDKIIVPDSYLVPTDLPYYDAENVVDSFVVLSTPSMGFDTTLTNWYEMERGEGPYANWKTFRKWIITQMGKAAYITKQGCDALRDIISFMEKI